MENKVKDNREEQRIEREAREAFPAPSANDFDTNIGYGYALREAGTQRLAYIAGATKEASRNKEDAIGFAEWVRDKHWQFFFTERLWFNMVDNTENPRTTEQLYNEYINQKV